MSNIIITASRKRRRAGLAFQPGQPVTLDLAELTGAQLAALRADPVLSVKSDDAPARSGNGGKGRQTKGRKPSAAEKRAAAVAAKEKADRAAKLAEAAKDMKPEDITAEALTEAIGAPVTDDEAAELREADAKG